MVGFPGTDLFSPDNAALEIIDEACSDLGSRLFLRIREEMGPRLYRGQQPDERPRPRDVRLFTSARTPRK